MQAEISTLEDTPSRDEGLSLFQGAHKEQEASEADAILPRLACQSRCVHQGELRAWQLAPQERLQLGLGLLGGQAIDGLGRGMQPELLAVMSRGLGAMDALELTWLVVGLLAGLLLRLLLGLLLGVGGGNPAP